jgi:Flp pilus assembly protein TadG
MLTMTRARIVARRSALAAPIALARCERAVAAVEFAIIMPILVLFMLAGGEIARFVNTSRQITEYANSLASLVAEQSNGVTQSSLDFFAYSGIVTFPQMLADAARTGNGTSPFTSLMSITVSNVRFTPTPTSCTSNCTYKASVVWTYGNLAQRPCGGLQAVSDAAPPALDALPKDIFTSGTLIVVDLVYSYNPVFGGGFIPPLTIRRSVYLQPRYVTTVTLTNASGAMVCPTS